MSRTLSNLVMIACVTFVSLESAPPVCAQTSQQVALKPNASQRDVSFKTSDGWIIHGTLTIPGNLKTGEKAAAALLLHSSMHTSIVWAVYPGWVKVQNSIATLRIDWRGRGKSEGKLRYVEFSADERERVALDVQAALNFLGEQMEVDSSRLSIVAEEFSTQAAVIAGMSDHRVRAFVLLSGWLDQKALSAIATGTDQSILFIVSKEDTRSLPAMSQAYASASRGQSEWWLQDGLGVGAAMGSVWRNRYPERPESEAIDFAAGAWLVTRLGQLGSFREVKLQTRDGWLLYATFGMPGNIPADTRVPGVVLLPTALSDRTSYYKLERTLIRQGIAVINLDWRGIGQSTNKGSLIQLSLADMASALTDVEEATKYLMTAPGVDPDRIGVLGSAFGAKLAINAAKADRRIRAVAMLTPVTKPQELAADSVAVETVDRPLLLITGDGFGEATKKVAAIASQNNRNTVVTFPGGTLGYELFNVDENLESTITQWFKRQFDSVESNNSRGAR